MIDVTSRVYADAQDTSSCSVGRQDRWCLTVSGRPLRKPQFQFGRQVHRVRPRSACRLLACLVPRFWLHIVLHRSLLSSQGGWDDGGSSRSAMLLTQADYLSAGTRTHRPHRHPTHPSAAQSPQPTPLLPHVEALAGRTPRLDSETQSAEQRTLISCTSRPITASTIGNIYYILHKGCFGKG